MSESIVRNGGLRTQGTRETVHLPIRNKSLTSCVSTWERGPIPGGSRILGTRIRKCRLCKSEYQVPSQWPGHCSERCKEIRKRLNVNITNNLKRTDQRKWLELRYKVLKRDGGKCLLCGSRIGLQVDHINPKSGFPELALDINNLQTLCLMCNRGKGAWDQTDWR